MNRLFKGWAIAVAFALLAAGLTPGRAFASTGATNTDTVTHSAVVSAVPSALTPNIDDGTVLAFAQVGNTMVVGGHFTGVTDSIAHYGRTNIFAFDVTTGNVLTTFAPAVNGDVNSLVPGPAAGTVIVGGAFTVVSATVAKSLTMLSVSTGARITTFVPAVANGAVKVLKRAGTRLFVGGSFTTLGGIAHGGIGTLNATTGALDPFVASNVATHHNWVTGSTGSKGLIGVTDLAITPDGKRMVVIGNFKTIDGLPRDQAAVFDLSGTKAVVLATWRTQRFAPACYSSAFDSTVSAVDISPDGSYFVVVSTGGGIGTLCDAAARFELSATGDSIAPTWVAYTGGDSLFSVAITGTAVYVGGHQRWLNNPTCSDCAGGGAVARPGLGAIDPKTGVPLQWNPGRNPRGVGAYSLFATPAGLWVGMDTDWIGNYKYKRMKMAFFPLAGGAPVAADTAQALPGNVYLGSAVPGATNVLYRVNAGGSSIQSLDAGPDWSDDSAATSTVRNSGSSATAYVNDTVARVDSTVPTTTPAAVFGAERWDPAHTTTAANLTWSFPVPTGTQVDVRLYFANRCSCTSAVGTRVFNVTVNGAAFLTNFDIAASAGDQTGTMRHVVVTSTGTVTVSLAHFKENPLIDGIEIVRTGTTATPATETWTTRSYTGSTVGAATPATTGTPISTVTTRAATMIAGRLYTASANGTFTSRTFDGRNFGTPTTLDPYHDATWTGVQNGSGSLYDSLQPSFYAQLPNLSSMFYDPATKRLYYTLFNSTALYYRTFSVDSGTIYPTATAVSGVSLPLLSGAFLSGGNLYYATRADGILHRVGFVSATGALSGTAVTVSGPAVDGVSWAGRVLFLAPTPPPIVPPTSVITSSCTGLTCTFDGSASTSPNGAISGYAWSFGDGTNGTGATTSHVYATSGPRTVTLTVTDPLASAPSSQGVSPLRRPVVAQAAGSCRDLTCTFTATGSSPDGTIASYTWDFGDGSTGTGATATHAYAAAGTFSATVTATDNASATGTASASVSPTAPVPSKVAFRGSAGVSQNQATATLTLPATVRAGDVMLLFASTSAVTTQATPGGWTVLGTQSSDTLQTTVWQRTATDTDAGTTVSVPFGTASKSDLHVLVYSGASAASTIAMVADGTTNSHCAPEVQAASGSWVVRYWADKSSTTTTWTAPAGVTPRDSLVGTGTGRVSTLLADSGGPVSNGGTGTATATTDATSGRGVSVTIVLATS